MNPLVLLFLTACVTDSGMGVDSVWEQEKLEAGNTLAVGAAESPASSARCVEHFQDGILTY